jgi:hypothetical protein
MTPEELQQIRQIVTETVAGAETRIKEQLIESMRDMQSEILRGLERFSRGNYSHLHRLDVSVARPRRN